MKTPFKIVVEFTIYAIVFISCKKQEHIGPESYKKSQPMALSEPIARSAFPDQIYHCCGMTVNVFTPVENSSKKYSFAINQNGQTRAFSVDSYGQISFSNPDKFSFEFAGHADISQTVKTWRLRRIDGKYLTAQYGVLYYGDKLNAPHDAVQHFLLSSLGNNLYKVLLPKLTICHVATLYAGIPGATYSIFKSFQLNAVGVNWSGSDIIMISVGLPNTF